jgi:pantoate--beta-alanine ligase
LSGALNAAAGLAAAGESSSAALLGAARATLGAAAIEPDYVSLVDPDTFEPRERLDRPALLVLAASFGAVRLIDNVMLEPAPANQRPRGEVQKICSA